jgi:putative DNA primase/helicase
VLCRKLARWASDNRTKLEACDPKLPEGAYNRLADNWRPLFAIAEVAGGDWGRRAAEAFALLTTGDDLAAHGTGTMLLADIGGIFAEFGADKLPSAKLAAALAEIEGRAWAEFGKQRKPITANQLAIQLRPFAIKPHTIRVGDETAKGYDLTDFTEAFERFLPNHPLSNRHTVTSPENTHAPALSETSHPETVLPFANSVAAHKSAACYGVTDPKPGEPEMDADLL